MFEPGSETVAFPLIGIATVAIQLVAIALAFLLVAGVAAVVGTLVAWRTRSIAAALAAGVGTLLFLTVFGFLWITGIKVVERPQSPESVVVVPTMSPPSEIVFDPPRAAPGPKSSDSPSAVSPARSSPPAEAPTGSSGHRATSRANAAQPKNGTGNLPTGRSPANDPAEAAADENQDQQALGELRRRIFERVVVALREIIAEEMPAEGNPSAETAIDSALTAAMEQRPIAEKPLPPPASPPDWLSSSGSAGSVVVVGPHVDVAECERHVYEAVQPVVAEFVANYLGPQWRDRLILPEEFIRTDLIRDRYVESVPASFGPMVQLHLLLSFDGKVKAQLAAQQLELVRRQRIAAIGTVFAGLLGVLGIAYLALRSDVARRGAGRSHTLAWAATATGVCVALVIATMRYVVF